MARRYKVVKVGRFDSPLQEVAFDNGNVVEDALTKAGITLETGEEVNDLNGNSIPLTKKLRDGMTLIITGNYKSGCWSPLRLIYFLFFIISTNKQNKPKWKQYLKI